MKFEKTEEDLTKKMEKDDEDFLVEKIQKKYDKFEDDRVSQIDDIKNLRNHIYNNQLDSSRNWNSKIELPDLYELSQTLKAHISENLYSHSDAMFDVSGATPQAQAFSNRQKAMLVNTFENMKIEEQLENVVNGIVETGESTLFVGWETKIKSTRRAQSLEEQLIVPTEDGFVVEEKVVYDNAKIKFIKSEDFVFDVERMDNWDSCAKIYRTFSDLEELISNKANNLLDEEKIENLRLLISDKKMQSTKCVDGNRLEILEYWGDIELADGEILKNWLVVVAGRKEIVRFEANPFVLNPFIYANIIKNPATGRGISPLKVAVVLNNISSVILNKQLDALSLMINPPYLAPKGCFKDEQIVKPGKIIEYDSALMPNAPVPLSFEKALHGWDFLKYFKSTIESATGIYKNMAGDVQSVQRTATELNYSASGQSARLNMILDAINRKVIIPMVEKTAEIIANFKIGREVISINDRGKTLFLEIDDVVRNSNYIYRYGDRKATIERKTKFRELFEIVRAFAEVPSVSQQVNWIECFKFALEQYGIENANNFLIEQNII